jgi:hypothetical protein
MKDNDLADISFGPMSDRHFETVRKLLLGEHFPKLVEQAVKEVLVGLVDPALVCSKFALTAGDLITALTAYSNAWNKYCADNDLITEVFWLTPEIAERAKAIEARALDRIENRRTRGRQLPPSGQSNET